MHPANEWGERKVSEERLKKDLNFFLEVKKEFLPLHSQHGKRLRNESREQENEEGKAA